RWPKAVSAVRAGSAGSPPAAKASVTSAADAVAFPNPANLGVLISGRGSNMQALIDAIAAGEISARIAVVISNRPDAAALVRAGEARLETLTRNHRGVASRDGCDSAVAQSPRERNVHLVCLAGFMRLIGGPMLGASPNAILNI